MHVLMVIGVAAALIVGVQAGAYADWTTPQNLLPPGQTRVSEPAQIAYDGAGNAYMLYVVNPQSRDGQLWLRTWAIGGAWSAPQSVPTLHDITNGIVFDVNDAGDMVVAWYDGAIEVERKPAGGAWGPITTYDAPGTAGPHQGCSFFPRVSIGNDGTAAVAWPVNSSCNGLVTVWRAMAAVYKPGTGWDASPQGWSLSPRDVQSYPDVAVADDGSVTVAFEVSTTVNDSYPYTVERDTAWHDPEQRSPISSGYSASSVSVVSPATAARCWRGSATTASLQWRKWPASGSRCTALAGPSTAALRATRRLRSTDWATRTSPGGTQHR